MSVDVITCLTIEGAKDFFDVCFGGKATENESYFTAHLVNLSNYNRENVPLWSTKPQIYVTIDNANEPETGGYAPIVIQRNSDDWTIEIDAEVDADDYCIKSKTVHFIAKGDIGIVTHAMLVLNLPDGSHKTIGIYKFLVSPIDLTDGRTLSFKFIIKADGSTAFIYGAKLLYEHYFTTINRKLNPLYCRLYYSATFPDKTSRIANLNPEPNPQTGDIGYTPSVLKAYNINGENIDPNSGVFSIIFNDSKERPEAYAKVYFENTGLTKKFKSAKDISQGKSFWEGQADKGISKNWIGVNYVILIVNDDGGNPIPLNYFVFPGLITVTLSPGEVIDVILKLRMNL